MNGIRDRVGDQVLPAKETILGKVWSAMSPREWEDSDGLSYQVNSDGKIINLAPLMGDVPFGLSGVKVATKAAMTDVQLLTRVALKAENAIGGTGRFAGTAKHSYSNNLINRYQSIFGDRGLKNNFYFNKATGRGFLDVVNHNIMSIYDYKFGNAVMSNSQYLKYSTSFPGYSIQIIRT